MRRALVYLLPVDTVSQIDDPFDDGAADDLCEADTTDLDAEPEPASQRQIHLPLVAPKVRADCLPGGCNEARPCPWVTCRHHLERLDPDQPSCVLDVVDEKGALTLEEIGEFFGVTRERIRQIEWVLLRKLKRSGILGQWRYD